MTPRSRWEFQTRRAQSLIRYNYFLESRFPAFDPCCRKIHNMPAETWTLTSKRKSRASTAGPLKRRRVNDDDGSPDIRRTKSQQTLTQVQWMTPPTSFEEDDLYLRDIKPPQNAPLSREPRHAKKRNSTLTQMQFFDRQAPEDDAFDDAMLSNVHENDHRTSIAQCDGTYDSPRKSRNPKSTPGAARSSTKRKANPTKPESQEYKLSNKRRKTNLTDGGASEPQRRTSSRLASRNEVFSDPVQNLEYFNEALGTTSRMMAETITDEQLGYPLEIKDSTESDEGGFALCQRPQDRPLLPQTPKKRQGVIPSSQSPESLPPSTRGAERKPSDSSTLPQRTPLAERSINIPHAMSEKSPSKSRRSLKRLTPKKKIVVLNLPKQQGQGTARSRDRGVNLWSIPSSSSSQQYSAPSVETSLQIHSSPPAAGSQDSLPSVADLLRTPRPGQKATNKEHASECSQAIRSSNAEPTTIVRDFSFPNTEPLQGECLRNDESPSANGFTASTPKPHTNPAPEMEISAEEVNFESPIANDTQFNLNVQCRISSPLPLAEPTVYEQDDMAQATFSPTPRTQPALVVEQDALFQSGFDEDLPQASLPLPRLIESPIAKSLAEVDHQGEEDDSDEIALPKSGIHQSGTHLSTTKVPLNDHLQGSSSPSLPSMKAVTQKSVRPASMPHPSQMSTQEETQAYMNMSSYPQQRVAGEMERNENITIKDSSSSLTPLSQIPQYAGESQGQFHVDLGLGEICDSEEEADLDLDPPSLPLPVSQCSPDEDKLRREKNEHPGRQKLDNQERPASEKRSKTRDVDPTELVVPSSQESTSLPSSPNLPALQEPHSPIPGFDNDTQSNFTQNGHVTAAYIHRQREAGVLPSWFVPKPYQVPGYTRRR